MFSLVFARESTRKKPKTDLAITGLAPVSETAGCVQDKRNGYHALPGQTQTMSHLQPNSLKRHSDNRAFTLAELLVVIAVIGLLVLTVLPVLGNTAERSKRAACQNNLRQLAAGMTVFAGNNAGRIVAARNAAGVSVQNCLNPVQAAAAATVGLNVKSNATVWTCPDRPGLPVYEPQYPQWVIGYQYFGGITNWLNPAGVFQSRSPSNLASASPFWTLAADAVMKNNGTWGGEEPGREYVYRNMPPHHALDSMIPEGGNQAFVDGSVQWIPFEQMYFLHTWSTSSRVAYFYQEPRDFPPVLRSALASLRATP